MTLVELLVVLAIIGLLLSVSVPGLVTYAKRTRLTAATRQVVSLLSLARSTAISTHQPHAFELDLVGRQFRVANVETGETLEQGFRVPPAVTVTFEVGGQPLTDPRLVFRASGALLGQSTAVVLTDGDRRRTVTVSSATGTFAIE